MFSTIEKSVLKITYLESTYQYQVWHYLLNTINNTVIIRTEYMSCTQLTPTHHKHIVARLGMPRDK